MNDARLAADRRVRYELLCFLHAERANRHGGWVTAAYLQRLCLDPLAPMPEPVDHDRLRRLLVDLVNKGFVRHEDNREYVDDPIGPQNQTYTITADGTSFVEMTAPPDPDLDDGRRPRPGK